jgi:hypothetical protein
MYRLGLAPEDGDLEDEDDFEPYLSLEDLPVDDPPPEPDGNQEAIDPGLNFDPNDLRGPESPVPLRMAAEHAVRAAPRRRVVPLARTMKRGVRGKDVLALQRALRKAKLSFDPKRTGRFDRATGRAVREFQQKKGLAVDGEYGPLTHAKLMPRYDAYGLALMIEAKRKQDDVVRPSNAVKIIEAAALHGYNNRHLMYYTQGPARWSGIAGNVMPPGVPIWSDCSSFATWCFWVADRITRRVPDPNRLAYRAGYTGTLCWGNAARKGSKRRAALGFYGPHTHGHVVISIGDGSMCVSMGSTPGPFYLPANYRSDVNADWSLYPGVHP